ncbi:hypothetical protein F5148DRAFT_1153181 [Russula earlei]|uniref:Uncharacterized protein n=1 Tax=Russula earlei TaxID=71964 RepID=A0ACC0TUT7_9AGAM|nr:hypothetical protein F5148DRAFT_1153181 [Russula earlei]
MCHCGVRLYSVGVYTKYVFTIDGSFRTITVPPDATSSLMSFLLCCLRLRGPSEGSCKRCHRARCRDRVTISTLPDEVLVQIFYFYANDKRIGTNGWHTLVQVCQRWRYVVFASPRSLNLQLVYTGKRPMSEMLDVWPVLPVVAVLTTSSSSGPYVDLWANISAALESEHHHRICGINLFFNRIEHWERWATAMQKPFPALTFLHIDNYNYNVVTSLPDSFLGGSAPLLRHLELRNCPFPGIPKLLLSSNRLVYLSLVDIPDSGYISPQDLGTTLSVMSRLETLRVQFRSRRFPQSRPRSPSTCSVLSALTCLDFEGAHGYLEDLLAQIDAPLVNKIEITFFMDPNFVVPQLHRLIRDAEWFKTFDKAFVCLSYRAIRFVAFREESYTFPDFDLEICFTETDYTFSSLVQVCSSSMPLLSSLVQLEIVDPIILLRREDDTESTQWLELLAPFTAVKDLRLGDQVGRRVCQALEELAKERVTEVLPALQNIFLTGLKPSESVPKLIERFITARQLSGHPVAVYPWRGGEELRYPPRIHDFFMVLS